MNEEYKDLKDVTQVQEITGNEELIVTKAITPTSNGRLSFSKFVAWITKQLEDLNLKKVEDVMTIAELRTKVGVEGQLKNLLGYYEAGDKPPLLYKWVSGVAEDDGGSVINSTGGRWEALFGDVVDVRHFGANEILEDNSEILKYVILKYNYKIITGGEIEYNILKKIHVSNINVNIDTLRIVQKSSNTNAFTIESTVKKNGNVILEKTLNESNNILKLDSVEGIKKGDLIYLKCLPQKSGNILVGRKYIITKSGDFTSVGAVKNTVGEMFTATANIPNYNGGELLVAWEYDTREGITNSTYGEVNRVMDVDIINNTVTLYSSLAHVYNYTYNLHFYIYNNFSADINNLKIKSENLSLKNGGIVLQNLINSSVKNSNIIDSSTVTGIAVSLCYSTNIYNTFICNNNKITTDTGYGIQDNGSRFTEVNSILSINNRRGVDFSGTTPSVFGCVKNSCIRAINLSTTDSCLGTHGASDNILFENNTLIGGVVGVVHRGKRINIINNTFINNYYYNIVLDYGNGCVLTNNTSKTTNQNIDDKTTSFIQLKKEVTFNNQEPLILNNNTANGLKKSFIRIGDASTNSEYNSIYAFNNIFTLVTVNTNVDNSFIDGQNTTLTNTINNSLFKDNICVNKNAKYKDSGINIIIN